MNSSRLWEALTSLKLTILCLVLLMVLVVLCTLAQVHLGTLGAVNTYIRSFLIWWPLPGVDWSIAIFPGGALVGLVLVANLLAVQLERLELSWKKTGLWIAHAGLVLLVAGEFVTSAFQVETQLAIEQGQTLNYLESPRDLELAVIDTTEPAFDDVHGIPVSLLARGESTAIPGTPLSLLVKEFYPNAVLTPRTPNDPVSLADHGAGTEVTVQPMPPVTADDRTNRAAAWIEPRAAGRSYGTWLVSNGLDAPQSFVHEGRTYLLVMRARREYLPYAVTLKEFRHDVYPGTDIPKNFSSLVHLSNPSRGEERDVLISMNQPLRYLGKAFYQASFGKGDTLSILQVVENPGWWLPYLSGALVTLGLAMHFAQSLRRGVPHPQVGEHPVKIVRYAAWTAGGIALLAVLVATLPHGKVGGFDLDAFGRLPVLEGGRVKPIDSLARNSLLMIRGQQSFRHQDRTVTADEWLLDVLFRPAQADAQPIWVINDPDILGLMGLQQTSNRYFSFATLAPHLQQIQEQALTAQSIDAKQRTRFQSAIVNLFERLLLYFRLRNTIQPESSPGLAAEIATSGDPGAIDRQRALTQIAFFRPLPPPAGESNDGWRSTGEALQSGDAGFDPALQGWARLGAAWKAQDSGAFNTAAVSLATVETTARPEAMRQAAHELVFNRAQPFYAGMVIYLLALLVLFVSWLRRPDLLQPAASALLYAGALIHTAGLVSRVLLQGRPPVTNLYSSAVFVGWAAVIAGIIVERFSRRGFGIAVAAASGFASLIVAHHLTGSGDTLEMMRAVLDSNFWLTTHVVTITIGYSGTFLAGALAIGYTLRQHLARRLEPETTSSLVSMTYGVICFALLFSFVGTVLGGIWADQSWGRFWGWDPKENGALLIVLWGAVILHARLGGYVREQGLMAMAVFGNVITSLSWFGVNMLGVGLHSYGFMDQAFWALIGFGLSQLALMAVCLLPRHFNQ